MAEFKTTRLADENLVSSVDDAVVALERAITTWLGIRKDQDIQPMLSEVDIDGKVLSDLIFKGFWGVQFEVPATTPPTSVIYGKIVIDSDGWLNIINADGDIVNRINCDNGSGQGWQSDILPDYDEDDGGKILKIDADVEEETADLKWGNVDIDEVTGFPDLDGGSPDDVATLKGAVGSRSIVWEAPAGGGTDPAEIPSIGGKGLYVLRVNLAEDGLEWAFVGVPLPTAGVDTGKVLTADAISGFDWQNPLSGIPSYDADDISKILYVAASTGTPASDLAWAHWQQFTQILILKVAAQSGEINAAGSTRAVNFTTNNVFVFPGSIGDGWVDDVTTDTITYNSDLCPEHAFRIDGNLSFNVHAVGGGAVDVGFGVALNGSGYVGVGSWIIGSGFLTRLAEAENFYRVSIPFNGVVKFDDGVGPHTIKLVVSQNSNLVGGPDVNTDNYEGVINIQRLANYSL